MRKELEMMRILRVPPLGKLVVEINEDRYETLAAVADPKLRQRIMAAIGELVSFAGGYSELESAGFVPQLTPPKPKPAEPPADVPPELRQQQEAFLNSLEQRLEAEKSQPAAKGRSGSLFSVPETRPSDAEPMVEISETGEVQPTAPPSKPMTIAEQIDLILQKHVAANPALASRGIRLEQHPSGGLQILVDGRSYEKPADIEDVEVQQLIKTAVKEWNAAK